MTTPCKARPGRGRPRLPDPVQMLPETASEAERLRALELADRRARNRVSAIQSRERAKAKLVEAREEVKRLQLENDALHAEHVALNRRLRALHVACCSPSCAWPHGPCSATLDAFHGAATLLASQGAVFQRPPCESALPTSTCTLNAAAYMVNTSNPRGMEPWLTHMDAASQGMCGVSRVNASIATAAPLPPAPPGGYGMPSFSSWDDHAMGGAAVAIHAPDGTGYEQHAPAGGWFA